MPSKMTPAPCAEPAPDTAVQVEMSLPLRPQPKRKAIRAGTAPTTERRAPSRLPRITRLMALAIKLQDMIDRGEIHDYAEIAQFGHVTRARVTQIMNLLNLAPDIQELLIDSNHRASVKERQIRAVSRHVLWVRQRCAFEELLRPRTQ
jgi:hypothetical protein